MPRETVDIFFSMRTEEEGEGAEEDELIANMECLICARYWSLYILVHLIITTTL